MEHGHAVGERGDQMLPRGGVGPITDEPTMESPYNPNGSYYAIEGIISRNGQILGKMGHSERYEDGLFKNIEADLEQPLFENAVKYFKK